MKSKIVFAKTDETRRLPLYMTTIGYWEHQPETVRPSGFPDYQIHQIMNGHGTLIIQDNEFTVGPGEVFFLFPGVPHRYAPIGDRWELAYVSFQGREASQLLSYAGVNGSGVGKLRTPALMRELKRMLASDGDRSTEFELECSKQIYSLLVSLKRLLAAPMNHNDQLERLAPVLRHITRHLNRTLSLAELAEIAGVSPQYLCRLFQRSLNVRPTDYINRERINESKRLMFSKSDKKLYEIAHQVGYENPSYFCSVFKRHTGMSPEHFKKLHGLY